MPLGVFPVLTWVFVCLTPLSVFARLTWAFVCLTEAFESTCHLAMTLPESFVTHRGFVNLPSSSVEAKEGAILAVAFLLHTNF